jgi:TorA maturation chaperone TorD
MTEEVAVSSKAEAARARAGLYRLVSRMVAQEPDEAFLKELNTPAFRETATGLGLSPPAVPASPDAQSAYDDLAEEFARLFILPGTPLHPYESVQRGEGQLWGEATAAVRQAYQEAGFTLHPETNMVPDHLGVEFEFMAHLTALEAERWEGGSPSEAEALQERQKAFLREHLLAWAVAFAHTLRAEASHPYYSFLADLLETVLESDASFLSGPDEE